MSDCMAEALSKANERIKELEAEVERLNTQVGIYKDDCKQLAKIKVDPIMLMEYVDQRERIEKLRAALDEIANMMDGWEVNAPTVAREALEDDTRQRDS